jgi:hypothetical protein
MGLTAKQRAGYQRRTLRVIRETILALSSDWEDVDQYNLNILEDLADKVEEVAAQLVDARSLKYDPWKGEA